MLKGVVCLSLIKVVALTQPLLCKAVCIGGVVNVKQAGHIYKSRLSRKKWALATHFSLSLSLSLSHTHTHTQYACSTVFT